MASHDGEPVRARLLQGIRWTALESVIVSAGNFAAAVLAARLLGVVDYGAYSIIRSTGYMMAGIAGMGLGFTATKHTAELRKTDPVRLGRILGLCSVLSGATGLLFAFLLLAFAPDIAERYLQAPNIGPELRLAAFYLFFTAVNGYQSGALVGFEAFASLAGINFVQVVVMLVFTGVFAWYWGLMGASLALGTAAFANWFLHHLAIRRELRRFAVPDHWRGLSQEKAVFVGFTLPAALAGMIGAVAIWTCNALLVRQPDGLTQMAIFSACYYFRSIVLFVPGLLHRVVSPILCNMVGERAAGYARMFGLNVAISAVAALLAGGVLFTVAPYLLGLFGRDFTGGLSVAYAVIGLSVVEVMANTFYQPLLAHGKQWWQMRIMLAWSGVLVGTTLWLAPAWGGAGLAYAYMAAHLTSLSLYMWVGLRK